MFCFLRLWKRDLYKRHWNYFLNRSRKCITVTYSDGSTEDFEISASDGKDGTNGINGKDGEDLKIEDIYESYVKRNGQISFEDFLSMYLSFNMDYSYSIHESLLSCVKIYTEFTETVGSKKVEIYTGAGVIYKFDDEYCYIITNYHVVFSKNANQDNIPAYASCVNFNDNKIARKIKVYLYGSENIPTETENLDSQDYTLYDYGAEAINAEYIGGSITKDIAVVRAKKQDVLNINEKAKEVKIADSYIVGETAIAIGNPEGQGISVSQGIVCVDNENISLSIDGTSRYYRSIRIDSALYSGSSGGGLFNKYGELIGITNAGDTQNQNINYAIPLLIVTTTADNIIHYANDQKEDTSGVYIIKVGFTVMINSSKYCFDEEKKLGVIVEDVKVTELTNNSIASNIGFKENDLVKAVIINNERFEVNRMSEIGDFLLMIRPEDNFSFEVLRNSETTQTLTFQATSENFNKIA